MKISKKLAFLAAPVALILGGGIAFAAWNVTGSGNGNATAGFMQKLVIADSVPVASLFPGVSNSGLTLVVTNPNGFPVSITDVNGNGAITSGAGVACDASTGVLFANQAGLAVPFLAGETRTVTVPGVSMDNTSDNSCQGTVFTVPVTVVAVSA